MTSENLCSSVRALAVNGWGRILAASLVAGLLSVQGADAAETFRQLKGKEIRAKFAGRDFTDDVHWADAFGRDGRMTSYDMGKKTTGTWRVEKDQLCTSLDEEDRCYLVWTSGTTVQLRDPDGGAWTLDGVLEKPSKRD
ncbi:hypothetical protein [Mesorhizobium captivum]|uniref:hypothetical protein n=1 Tax=Mesorhizobium captivum TaxID=3072319 RepID=UPI002A244C9A|nr:hypothetical protein [Mesorhizobium sp. VK23E]MDX8512145.1 hypothetical protein [Mesorhizobium sp. VK23E]